MKGENYLYFNGHAGEPAATDRACLIPASAVLGISLGIADGTYGMTGNMDIYMSFDGFVGDGNSRGAITFRIVDGKHVEAMDDIIAAINSTPGDGFVVIGDDHAGTYCSEHIEGISVDSAVA